MAMLKPVVMRNVWPSFMSLAKSFRVIATSSSRVNLLRCNPSEVAVASNNNYQHISPLAKLPHMPSGGMIPEFSTELLSPLASKDFSLPGGIGLATHAETHRQTRQEKVGEVEVSGVECPSIARSDIEALFPVDIAASVANRPLAVLQFVLRTNEDMSVWSEAVAIERENLTAEFIDTATVVCRTLTQEGHLADFVDPSSGRLFLSTEYRPATLFETDYANHYFGATDINDLGCCKVVSHKLWGTRCFVGTVITDAPLDSPVIKRLFESM